MRIELRQTKTPGIVQITTLDERWYQNEKTGEFYPSVTWISESYPKGVGFYRWLAEKGWDEAEAIKQAAGDKGSKVHHAIESLLRGNTLTMDEAVTNGDGEPEPLTVEEWECLTSFVLWWKDAEPTLIHSEQVVFSEEFQYAGTLDLLCEIDGVTHLVDFKTSRQIWPSHELQLTAYNHALPKPAEKMAILQLGYKLNKRGWKLTEVGDKWELFKAAYLIWGNENDKVFPKQKDYPITLSLNGADNGMDESKPR